MKANANTAVLTPAITLVPYSPHHVPTYHTWMADPALQAATASEPLTLDQEHAMQHSWRLDRDKLTFILCLPLAGPEAADIDLLPSQADVPDRMVGDVNLFLESLDPEDVCPELAAANRCKAGTTPVPIAGELEIMIASPAQRRRGLGRAALLAFLWYVRTHLVLLLEEYEPSGGAWLVYLRVRIGAENTGSIALFEGLGFERVPGGPNYFGEEELRLDTGKGWWERVVERVGWEKPREVRYDEY
ncbi:hypothetical protein EJ06DRAFT_12454 [Trichodelitschia bisporula]|uniref:N-acetyltransferase domain-containing protein n=1 Tax=Trichodelitschia bisporula TaxID=703511 RepID=A0A6G1IA09_9PEZI|nr:hypothetical protein EJ06DRAFT_12454 [Trichodelitschia bisporula]